MPRQTRERNPNGFGSIRKKEVVRNGKKYIYYEGRYTVGKDPITGKTIRKSVTGYTKKEAGDKLKAAIAAIDNKTYVITTQNTVKEWLDLWSELYLNSVKAETRHLYCRYVENHIIPHLGSYSLSALNTNMIQKFYNDLQEGPKPVSAKTVKNIHGVLSKALDKAVANKYISDNPAKSCTLPKVKQKKVKPLEDDVLIEFIKRINGHKHEILYKIAVFTGLREGELLGLTWDCIDFEKGTLLVQQQLQKERKAKGKYFISPTKTDTIRKMTLPPTVIELFRQQKEKLHKMQQEADDMWTEKPLIYSIEDNTEHPYDLVFRNEIGERLSYRTVYDCYKRILEDMGETELNFHGLRHTFATISLSNGDDVKTVQENLGHSSSKTTLDIYTYFCNRMRNNGAARMEQYIQEISNQAKVI